MFLVRDRAEAPAVEPTWFRFRDAALDHPVPLRIPRWDVAAGDLWLVTGPRAELRAAAAALAAPVAPGDPEPRRLRIGIDDDLVAMILGRRPGRWRWPWRRPDPADAVIARWLGDLPDPDPLEVAAAARFAGAALDHDLDLLVVDRSLGLLRAEARFRIGHEFRERAASVGLAVVTLSEEPIEGWIAVDRRARIRNGELQAVFE